MSQPIRVDTAKTVSDSPPGRYRFIDSIRGIAALVVLYHHTTFAFLLQSPAWEQRIIAFNAVYLDLGKVAVAVFFMVSGYVVPFSLKGPRSEGLERFAISRFFRLYPLYWFSIAAALTLPGWLHDEAFPTASVIGFNLTMLQQFFTRPNLIGVFWTLQIELIFYAICAGLFALGWLRIRAALVAASAFFLACTLVLAEARHYTARKLPVALPLALTLMFIGTLWKRYQLDNDRAAGRAVAWLVGAFVVLLPAVSFLAYNTDMGFGEHWYQYTDCYLIAIAVFFALTTFARIHAAWVIFLGDVSYGVYLLHDLVLRAYFFQVAPRLPRLPAHVHLLFIGAITVGLCAVVHRWLEQPAINFGKDLSRRLRLRAKPISERATAPSPA